ncbi:hypothetical protein LRP30_31230 [Bradyrhizobium sp. C-145]|uniref:hypothetical protein n=1 Tax=Bradyrhizobium sp. C-145 TaxID=574727 RepID=UPI00201B7B0A|nr:hypothetical protein [Bradyrhizobium sp. C-145]UQR61380.1 hypothetical protein LRP30_31230 [Bradyrhizobium sp. C-145]
MLGMLGRNGVDVIRDVDVVVGGGCKDIGGKGRFELFGLLDFASISEIVSLVGGQSRLPLH